ncbi:acetyltransferase [Pedobacter glucosidilyticus]|uniref:acetyltransferase n=1 Tax=Pedobacter glucosidilyticus TaxID=1122941 RepID=UPI00040DFBFF|nr:acetyltransferase [Pedobacter glucosidilyticus]
MNKNNLILIGAGGHCKSCIEVIEAQDQYQIKGILDLQHKVGETLLGYPIIGTDNDLPNLTKQGYHFLITLGQIKSVVARKSLYQKLKSLNAPIATIISPYAIVSKHASIAQGTILMHHVKVNAGVQIGENCILNTACNVEHDVHIGHHCHISTQAVINGDVTIADEVFIGSGAIIRNGIHIASSTIIGAGAVLLQNIDEPGIFVGNPSKRITHG